MACGQWVSFLLTSLCLPQWLLKQVKQPTYLILFKNHKYHGNALSPILQNTKAKLQQPVSVLVNTTLTVDNLGFCYPLSKNNIFENISFKGNSGEIIGVTGSISSGKSTLDISLLGLYPYIGNIKIDGKELKNYSEYARSQMISYLGHKPQLLSDSIYNNITLGNGQDISSVLKDVCFETDLSSMPLSGNTLVGNSGIRLSGGQQARISLARTLLTKSKIIILDDPFSAIDMKTEEKIIKNLKNNYKDYLV